MCPVTKFEYSFQKAFFFCFVYSTEDVPYQERLSANNLGSGLEKQAMYFLLCGFLILVYAMMRREIGTGCDVHLSSKGNRF